MKFQLDLNEAQIFALAGLAGWLRSRRDLDDMSRQALAALDLVITRANRAEQSDHSPLITRDMTRIIGCTCGWRTPSDTADSDYALAAHCAIEKAANRERGLDDDEKAE